jgi:glutamyl-tRNA synthetase
MNGQYLSTLPVEQLEGPVRRQLEQMGISVSRDLRPLIDSVKARSRTILHVAEQVAVRLDPGRSTIDAKGESLVKKMGPAFGRNLGLAAAALEQIDSGQWQPDRLLETLKAVAESQTAKLGDIMQPVRVALTGSTVSEPVNELLAVVGRERSLRRLEEVARENGGVGAA